MDRRVEAYVDGELSEEERERFERILQEDECWASEVRQARRIKGTLRSTPTPSAPPELTQSILDRTSRAHSRLPVWKDALQRMVQTWRALVSARRQPAVDYAVGLALVAVAAFFIVFPLSPDDSAPSPQVASQLDVPVTAPYSEADLERAASKAKWAFATLSQVSASGPAPSEAPDRDSDLSGPRLGVTGAAPSDAETPAAAPAAEPRPLASQPGFVDLSEVDAWFDRSPSVDIKLQDPVLERVAEGAYTSDRDLAAALRALTAIQVRGYPMQGANPDSIARRAAGMADRLEASGWTRVLFVQSNDESSRVFLRRIEERVDGITVLSIDPDDRGLFMNVVGAIQPEQIIRIGEGLDVQSLEAAADRAASDTTGQ
jgi:hypothetical protein